MKKFLFMSLFMLFGCGKSITRYANNSPKLDLRIYLNGKTKAWGVLEDRKGNIMRRFTVDMQTVWNGNEGVLQEYFTFDDGEKSQRTWKINYLNDSSFTATAGDVVGYAKGTQAGNALQMKYILNLKVKNKNYKVSLDDWMFQLDEKHLINKSKITKFGITFAKLTIFFEKQ